MIQIMIYLSEAWSICHGRMVRFKSGVQNYSSGINSIFRPKHFWLTVQHYNRGACTQYRQRHFLFYTRSSQR